MTPATTLLSARHLYKNFSIPPRLWSTGVWNSLTAASEAEETASREHTPAQASGQAYEQSANPAVAGLAYDAIAAVDDVSLDVEAGETLAIVGESGSGKTTLARLLLRLVEPDAASRTVSQAALGRQELRFDGQDILHARGARLRQMRRHMQMIFQDPFSSLDPRMRVSEIVGEPLEIHESQLGRNARRERVVEALRVVGLDSAVLGRFPHEFSGGQRQRIGIARALVLRPKLVVADEPVSALDVSVGAQILELLRSLQVDFGLTYVVISHSLPVVAQLATRVAVMCAGRLVEVGAVEQVLTAPADPYTQSLLAAVPTLPF